MFTRQLQECDESFKVVKETDFTLETISHYMEPKKGSIVFIGREKYLKILENFEVNDIGLIFDEKVYNDLDKKRLNKFLFIGTTSHLSKSICTLSKYFFFERKEANNFVDGRQMGSTKIDPHANIAQNVHIGENVTIEKNVTIYSGVVIHDNCTIKEGTTLFSNVVLYSNVSLGKNCRVHAGTVIGSDGFGYNFIDGKHEKIWHLYGVEISDDVEIGANCTIDCGAFRPTRIGEGTRLDNMVHVAHNVQIGKGCILCGMVGVSGSVSIGNYCVFGGKAAIAPHVVLEDGCQVAGLSGLTDHTHWKKGSKIGGYPASSLRDWIKAQSFLRKSIKRK